MEEYEARFRARDVPRDATPDRVTMTQTPMRVGFLGIDAGRRIYA